MFPKPSYVCGRAMQYSLRMRPSPFEPFNQHVRAVLISPQKERTVVFDDATHIIASCVWNGHADVGPPTTRFVLCDAQRTWELFFIAEIGSKKIINASVEHLVDEVSKIEFKADHDRSDSDGWELVIEQNPTPGVTL